MKVRFSLIAVILAAACSATAAVFPVSNVSDSGPGSLRAAVIAANGTAGADEIVFIGVSGTIPLSSPLPVLTGDTTITGPGSAVLAIGGGGLVQILSVAPGVTVQMAGVTLRDGFAGNNAHGGAVVNRGTLTLTDCTLASNQTTGGFGGAIYNEGNATLARCKLISNRATGGTSAGCGINGGWGGGGGGFGGAIYSTIGLLNVLDCTFERNAAFGGNGFAEAYTGPNGSGGTGGGPNGGVGGVRPPDGSGTAGGVGGFGSGGGGGSEYGSVSSGTGGVGGVGGFGGGGGGSGSSAGWDRGGEGGFGGGKGGYVTGSGGGGAAFGGALFTHSGTITISRSSLVGNSVVGGRTSEQDRGGGGAGMGAAIFNYGAIVNIDESELRANGASGAHNGGGYVTTGPGGTAGAAVGGAITNFQGSMQLLRCCIASNSAVGGDSHRNPGAGRAEGAGIAAIGGSMDAVNTTLSVLLGTEWVFERVGEKMRG